MRILKEGVIYLSVSVFQKIIPFLLMPFLTRMLSTKEYGVLSIFMVITSIYMLIIGGSLSGFIRIIYHKSTDKEFVEYIGNAMLIFIILSLLAYIVTLIFESDLFQLLGINNDYLYLALFVAIARFMIGIRLVIYQTMRKPLSYAKLQIISSVIEMMLVILLVFYLHKGVEGRVLSVVISGFIMGVIASYLMHKNGLLNIKFNPDFLRRIGKFIIPLLPHSVALTAFFTVDKLILSSSGGLSIVGELAVSLSLALPIWMLAESINTAFMPWSFERFREGKLDIVVGASYLLLIGLFIVGVLYSIFLYYAFDLIVGENFSNAIYPAMVLIWVGWLKLAYYLFAKAVSYSENMNYLPVISISSGFIYLGLIYLNIENITLMKISFYMIVMQITMSLGVLILSQKTYPQPWYNYRSITAVLLILKELIFNFFNRKSDVK